MMEENYKRQLNDVQVSLAVSEDKCRKLSEAIELERSLRMDDVYRREVTSEEMKAATLQRVAAEETVFRKDEEIIRLRAEAEGLREAARAALAIKDKALSQLRSYEMQINSVDRDNSEFRVRLHASEVEAAKLRHKNDQLKAKLESIRPHEIHQAKEARAKSAADRALASLSAAGPGAAAGAGGAGRARHQVALLAASSSFISREGSSSLSASTLAQALALTGGPLSLTSHQHQQQHYHHHRRPAARGLSEQPSLSALSSITGISGHW
jgi:regulator of replication initiation timing